MKEILIKNNNNLSDNSENEYYQESICQESSSDTIDHTLEKKTTFDPNARARFISHCLQLQQMINK